VTAEDIERAQKILRGWRSRAQARGNKQALEDVEHIMRVIKGLYAG
jgi:hypothetical protein